MALIRASAVNEALHALGADTFLKKGETRKTATEAGGWEYLEKETGIGYHRHHLLVLRGPYRHVTLEYDAFRWRMERLVVSTAEPNEGGFEGMRRAELNDTLRKIGFNLPSYFVCCAFLDDLALVSC